MFAISRHKSGTNRADSPSTSTEIGRTAAPSRGNHAADFLIIRCIVVKVLRPPKAVRQVAPPGLVVRPGCATAPLHRQRPPR